MYYLIFSYVIVFLVIAVFYHKIVEKEEGNLLALIAWFGSPFSLALGVVFGAILLIGFLVMTSAKKLNELMGRIQIKFVKGEDVPL